MAHGARTLVRRAPAGRSHHAVALAGVALGALLLGEALARAAGMRVAPGALAIGALVVLVGAGLLVAVLAGRRHLAARSIQARVIAWNALTPAAFEREVARLFARAGYRVRVVGAAGDGGVDVRVWPERFTIVPRSVPGIVQCKRYGAGRAVGPAIVRELIGARAHERAGAAWLATTGRVTMGARRLAAAERIVVLDAAALAAWDARLRGPC